MAVVVEPKLRWSFDDKGPTILIGKETKGYSRSEQVDPVPCYPHNLDTVKETLTICESKFPTKEPIHVYVTSHEGLGRTSAWTDGNISYQEKDDMGNWDRPAPHPYIVLFGKRTPIHPAQTRYLVAHEYGHVIDTLLAYKRYKTPDPTIQQDEEYEKLRGIIKQDYYGPGTWHLDPGEIFANDFRIAVCNIEPEFWPHDVPHPYDSPQVIQWWEERVKEGL